MAFNSPGGWLALFWSTLLSAPSHANKLLAGYVALRALGIHANFVDILLLQTLVMFLLYFAPTPGASGIGEVLSAAVMSSYVPRELTPIYILLWRLTLTYWTLAFGFVVFSGWVRQGLKSIGPGHAGRAGTGRARGRRHERRAGNRRAGIRCRASCGACWATSVPTAGRPPRAVLLLLSSRDWRWSARASPSTRSTWPSPSRPRAAGPPGRALPGDAPAEFVVEYARHPAHHAGRSAGDVRPPDGDLRPASAPQHRLLRPQPGGPADDPGHLGRGDAERAVLLRRGDRLRRRLHAPRHHGHDAGHRLAARAGDLLGDPAGVAHRARLPPPGARGLPGHPPPAGPAQRLPAGAAHRDAGGAAVRPGGGRRPAGSPSSTAITWRRTSGRSRSTRSSSPWWSC